MKTRHLQTDVLIIGAGPSGMISALCLARRGISSVIVERSEGLSVHPKAHELSARSIEILHELGVSYDELRAEASPHEDASRIVFCGTIGEEFGCIDLMKGDGAEKYRKHLAAPTPYLNLSQVELEKILLSHVRACERTELFYGHQWESFEQDEEKVTSRVTCRKSGEELTVTSRYVICADGAGSRSRAALGIEMNGPDKIRDFVSAYFEADLSSVIRTRGKIYFIFSPEAPGSVFIAHHIEKRWVYHLPVTTPREAAEGIPREVVKERIHAALGRDDIPIEITSMSNWRMTAQVAERFRAGRAFLVGDAAHRFPPTGGLGMNSGIGDAHNLCWKLAMVLSGQAPERLLESYETERRPVIQTNCDESRRNFENMAEVVEAFGLAVRDIERVNEQMSTGLIAALPGPVRDWADKQVRRYGESVLRRYHRDPLVRERVLTAIDLQRPHFDRIGLDLGFHYEEGALVSDGTPAVKLDDAVSAYVPSTRPGARFPHFWLDGSRKQRSSHLLFDYRCSTLVLGARVNTLPEDRDAIAAVAEGLGVHLAPLDASSIPLCYRAAVHNFCQIESDGALLIRPDGHVAWRQQKGVVLSAELIRSILQMAGLDA